jgi:hypothetical protein
LFALTMFASMAEAAETAAEVFTVVGVVNVATADGRIQPLVKGDSLAVGDTVVTGPNGQARLKFTDESWVVLRPDTRFMIEDYHLGQAAGEDRSVFNLLKGGFRALTGLIGKRSRGNVEMKTAVATIGIRGTDVSVRDCDDDCQDVQPPPPDGTYLGVNSGSATMDGGEGPQNFEEGEYGYVPSGGGTAEKIPASQAGAVMGFPECGCGGG